VAKQENWASEFRVLEKSVALTTLDCAILR